MEKRNSRIIVKIITHMKKIFFFSILFFLFIKSFCQSNYISGEIVDAITKAPLQSASVFAQNTTIGTTSDIAGKFKLALPNGSYDLIITFTDYQTEVHRISVTATNKIYLVIELKRKEKDLDPIIISSSNLVKDGWEIYGNLFLENFLGQTENSKSCILKNKETLRFYYSKKRNRLKVLSDKPLQFENDALGYNIRYSLDSFVYDYNTLITTYFGYPFFENLKPDDSSKIDKWAANRLKVYNGSMLHFMRCLYNKTIKEEGFEVRVLKKVKNKDVYIPDLNFYETINYKKNDSLLTVQITPTLNQVVVVYKKAVPEPTYLKINLQASAKLQLSLLNFTPNQIITVEKNGYFFKQSSILKSEYFSWKRMADTLPYDFETH